MIGTAPRSPTQEMNNFDLKVMLRNGIRHKNTAEWLGLKDKYEESEINILFPDEITAATREIEVTGNLLEAGTMLRDITLPPNTLVIMVKRGDKYLVPTGKTQLYLRDRLFLIAESKESIDEIV